MNFPPPERSRSGQQTPRQLPRVCNDYNRRGGCTRANCQELHLCTYFLQNRCTAERCNKAHELETPRNILLLEGLGWKGSDDLALALDTLRERARIPQVGVCFRYILDRCPDDSECKYLHLCYRYAKDTCPLGQNRCLYNFSHDLVHDKHNADLLTRFGLYDTPLTEIRSRLKEKMRHTPLEPQLCNHTKDCKGNCLRLHYCEVNLYAHCRHGDRCFKGHSLKNEHNRRVLKYFDWTEDYALKELKKRGRRCIAERCNKAHTLETPRNKRLLDGLGWKGIGDMEMALDILRRRDRAQAVSICFNYNMGICPSTECDRLHVCYRHVMDKQCSPDDCDLSHDLAHGYHNAVLLARAGLNDTPETEILRQMQEQVRRYPPQPMLCYHHKEHCLRLHYCEAFLHSRCRFGDRCYKGHSLKEPHNRRVLKFFGWTEEHVLEALRNDR
ncbi:hypothetical protein FJT64_013474 [Amphibalanus amphitrite]|uniref:C3H1-type domain-containing protein n=1 Tax=Amphibalanus amphitrite TaxID=1232801 RepID=A0A6A4V4Q9_AMPAM|nr:hypothetical protein FJT64_013474 [Amphibalanus amphitrite]